MHLGKIGNRKNGRIKNLITRNIIYLQISGSMSKVSNFEKFLIKLYEDKANQDILFEK